MLARWFESCKDAKINFYIGSGFYGDGLYLIGRIYFVSLVWDFTVVLIKKYLLNND